MVTINKKTLARKFSVAVAVVGFGIMAAVPSGAQTSTTTPSTTPVGPPSCAATIVPNPAPVGSFPSITVTGFQPNEPIVLDALGLGGDYQADENGVWTITFAQPVPADVAGQVFSYFWTGQESGTTCSASLAFVAATTATAPAPPAETEAVTAKPGFTG